MFNRYIKVLLILLISFSSLTSTTVSAKGNNVLIDVRIWPSKEYTRTTIETTKEVKFEYEAVAKKLNVKLTESLNIEEHISKINNAIVNSEYIKSVSYNSKNKIITYQLKKDIETNIFNIEPVQKYKHRLVIDIKNNSSKKKIVKEKKKSYFIVGIDAGHGGEDPGAIGEMGTYEKDIALTMAKKLKEKIDKIDGFKGVLIRDGDYFISLYDRVEKAHKLKANILISIHADSAEYKYAEGSSVYILSESGASSTSNKWLANKENLSDLIGGAKIPKKESYLKKILMDMVLTSNIKKSKRLAEKILIGIKENDNIEMHKNNIEDAGFVVLKSPKVPSVLIETAFISNKKEEKKLKDKKFQEQIVKAIVDGIKKYKEKEVDL